MIPFGYFVLHSNADKYEILLYNCIGRSDLEKYVKNEKNSIFNFIFLFRVLWGPWNVQVLL